MITIHNFSLDSSFKVFHINYELDSGNTTQSLKLYVGDRYGTSEFFDLTANAGSGNVVDFLIDIDDPIFTTYPKPVFDGLFTLVVKDNTNDTEETVLLNAYYSSLCLANSIITTEDVSDWNELNAVYLYLQATFTFIEQEKLEQAINAYSRVEAICASKGTDYLVDDVAECGEGTGCWIVNGVYIIKK